MRIDRRRRDPRAALLGRAGTTPTPLTGVPEDEIAERILDELRTSVQLRKVSDVPVGVFLSGGIDSSTNAALFSEGESDAGEDVLDRLRGRVRELPERAPLRPPDGRARRRRAPRAAAHRRRPARLPARGWSSLQDEPIADPVCVPVYYVSKLARDNGVIVAQVGEGADELFWGYPSWKRLPQPAALRRPAGARRSLKRVGRRPRRRGSARASAAGTSSCAAAPTASRSSGAAPRRSPTRRSSACSPPRLRREFDGLTSWDALAPIRAALRREGLGAARSCTG